MIACKDDTPVDTSNPRNYFEGIADDGSFAVTDVIAIKDALNIYYLIANTLNNGIVVAAFQGTETTYYPTVNDNALQPIAALLTGLVEEDPLVIAQATADLITDTSSFIQDGNSFLLLVDETGGSYSYRGGLTLTEIDHTINRIYGFMDIELTNAVNDSKFFTGEFEDVFFLDCGAFPCN